MSIPLSYRDLKILVDNIIHVQKHVLSVEKYWFGHGKWDIRCGMVQKISDFSMKTLTDHNRINIWISIFWQHEKAEDSCKLPISYLHCFINTYNTNIIALGEALWTQKEEKSVSKPS